MKVISSCGIFGVIRKPSSSRVKGSLVVKAIEAVRFRGSSLGAGFSYIKNQPLKNRFLFRVFINPEKESIAINKLRSILRRGVSGWEERSYYVRDRVGFVLTELVVERLSSDEAWGLARLIDEAGENGRLMRVFSASPYVVVAKGVGYPIEVADAYHIQEVESDAWLAHTRQPTNSPGRLPIWSHPFSVGDWSVVHNGDISSFGAHMELMLGRGVSSLVGTDSELIAFILDQLTRVEGLRPDEAALIVTGRPEIEWGEPDTQLYNEWRKLRTRYHGFMADGPFSVAALYAARDGDYYLIAFADRYKFRPLVAGEDDDYIYVASEECQIRCVSPRARVWSIEPGGVLVASTSKGLISPGRGELDKEVMEKISFQAYNSWSAEEILQTTGNGAVIDARGLSYHEVNNLIRDRIRSGLKTIKLVNVNGQRYIGIGLTEPVRIEVFGTPGNCLANLNEAAHIEVYGSVEDDVADTMHGGSVIVHGNAGDVLGQALQGGEVFVRGCAGNRVGIQMREYRDKRPYLIIGGRVDKFLGEYMAGGVIMVLGIDYLDVDGSILVGHHVASGMVGGKIVIRGSVPEKLIGVKPSPADVYRYLEGLVIEGVISEADLSRVKELNHMSLEGLSEVLPDNALSRISKLFKDKYTRKIAVEYRHLSDSEVQELQPRVKRFIKTFKLRENLVNKLLLDEKYTVIYRVFEDQK